MGALDYVMTQTRNEACLSQFTPEQLDFFLGIPAWAVATWALAVWGGVLGAILLLARLHCRHLPPVAGFLPLRPGHA
jgi:hypothetical protein